MRIGDYEIEAPFGNAGGLVKTPMATEMMARTAVGFVLAGSVVLERRTGNGPNGEVVTYYDSETDIMYNALGMPMPPDYRHPLDAHGRVQPKDFATLVDEDLQDMIELTHIRDKPLILNFGVTSERPDNELRDAALLLGGRVCGLDGLELNLSCPNIVTPDGGRHRLSDEPEALVPLLRVARTMREEGVAGNIGVRLAPFATRAVMRSMIETLDREGIDFVSIFNTFPGGRPLRPDGEPILQVSGGEGGMSGKGMALRAEEQTRHFMEQKELAGARFAVIGSNGVVDAETMQRRLKLGVDATSGTTLFWQTTERWGTAVNQLLQNYAELA